MRLGEMTWQKLGIATLYVAKGKRAVVIKRAGLDQIIGNRIGPKSRNEDIKRGLRVIYVGESKRGNRQCA